MLTTLATAASANSFPTRLVAASDGNFYGLVEAGGTQGVGDFVRLTTAGVLTDLYDFPGGFDQNDDYQGNPDLDLIQASNGIFYGTQDRFAFYQITTAGAFTSIQSLDSLNPGDNSSAVAFFQSNDGIFYGAFSAGIGTQGSIFQITPTGTATVVHTFSTVNGYGINADGQDPRALVPGRDGNFYGVTDKGGANGLGTFFSFTPGGALTDLHDFATGEEVPSLLVTASDGNLYGTGLNTITEFTTTGVVTLLHTFGYNAAVEGTLPSAFIQASDGHFYGALQYNGPGNAGTIYEFDPTVRPGTLQFSAPNYQTTENAGSVIVTVQRVGGTTGAVSVTCATDDEDYQGVGYTPTSATLSWADGDATDRTFTVPITDAHATSGTTDFYIILSAPTGGAFLGTQSQAGITITDNDTATPPTITITSPPDGAVVATGQSVPFSASILDPAGLFKQVQFTVNGLSVYTSTGAGPYVDTVTVPPIPGTYVVKAIVTDINGDVNTSTITVTAVTPPTGATPPTAAVLTPVNGLNLAAGSSLTFSFTAAPTNPNATLAKVSLYGDGVLVASFDGNGNQLMGIPTGRPVRQDATTGSSLFQAKYSLPSADKLVNMVAVALDSLGQTNVSTVASFHSTVTADKAPLVAITGLADGTRFAAGKTATANVTASDPDATANTNAAPRRVHRADASGGAVLAKLAFYLDGAFLSQAATLAPPFSFSFTPTVGGKNVLHAVATDGSGLSTVSEPVEVEVDATTVNLAVSSNGQAVEGGANGVIVVTRTGDTSEPLTVNYKVKGAAVAGVDYKKLPGSVTIPAGAVKAKIKVKPLVGLTGEGTLKLKVQLLAPTDGSYIVGTVSPVKIKLVGE